ncbi:hypothetical protein ACJMK2_016413 [Sinanodonta woodiana]|uniref:Uncharacterized protein n=1 Tax=Sinanodonta woodiana TaxID=1069815 RepID=A0ABD3UTH6_SINWO
MTRCSDLQPTRDKYYNVHDMKELVDTIHITNRWDEERTNIIFEGNGGIIYPTRSTPQYSTSQKPVPSVSMPTHDNRGRGYSSNSEGAEIIMKIIGLTLAALLAFAIIAFIIVWICRQRLNYEKKRKSLRSPLQDDAYNTYAEIEPLTINDKESPKKNSETIPLPITMQTRFSGVRYVSDQNFSLLGTKSGRSKTNDTSFNSKQSLSVHPPPLPPLPDLSRGEDKVQRRTERHKLSSTPCTQMDCQVSSIFSDALVDICERKNVYNPLNREADPVPYNHLKLGNTGSGAHMTDERTSVFPHDYFILDKEKGENPQHEEEGSHTYLILENEEDHLDKEDKSNPTVDKGSYVSESATIYYICPEEKSKIDEVHTYYVLENVASSVSLNHVKRSNTRFENKLEETSHNSPSQRHANTERSCASFEISNSILNLDDNENHAVGQIISSS